MFVLQLTSKAENAIYDPSMQQKPQKPIERQIKRYGVFPTTFEGAEEKLKLASKMHDWRMGALDEASGITYKERISGKKSWDREEKAIDSGGYGAKPTILPNRIPAAILLEKMGYEDGRQELLNLQLDERFQKADFEASVAIAGLKKTYDAAKKELDKTSEPTERRALERLMNSLAYAANAAASVVLKEEERYVLWAAKDWAKNDSRKIKTIFYQLADANSYLTHESMAGFYNLRYESGGNEEYVTDSPHPVLEQYYSYVGMSKKFMDEQGKGGKYGQLVENYEYNLGKFDSHFKKTVENETSWFEYSKTIKEAHTGVEKICAAARPFAEGATPVVAALSMLSPYTCLVGYTYFTKASIDALQAGDYWRGALMAATTAAPIFGEMAGSGLGIVSTAGKVGSAVSKGSGLIFQIDIGISTGRLLLDGAEYGLSVEQLAALESNLGFMMMPGMVRKLSKKLEKTVPKKTEVETKPAKASLKKTQRDETAAAGAKSGAAIDLTLTAEYKKVMEQARAAGGNFDLAFEQGLKGTAIKPEELQKRFEIAKAYYELLGDTKYAYKIISENLADLRPLDELPNRLNFEKTGGVLIPLGGSLTGLMYRIIPQEAYEAWKAAADAGIPCEEIVHVVKLKEGKVAVVSQYGGRTLAEYTADPADALRLQKQRSEITAMLKENGIVHGDLNNGNFVVEIGPDGRPSLRLIDWDVARLERKGGQDAESAPYAGNDGLKGPKTGASSFELTDEQMEEQVILHDAKTMVLTFCHSPTKALMAYLDEFAPSERRTEIEGRLDKLLKDITEISNRFDRLTKLTDAKEREALAADLEKQFVNVRRQIEQTTEQVDALLKTQPPANKDAAADIDFFNINLRNSGVDLEGALSELRGLAESGVHQPAVGEYNLVAACKNYFKTASAKKDSNFADQTLAIYEIGADGVRRELDINDPNTFFTASFDPTLLRRAVGNICSNAERYGNKRAWMEVEVTADEVRVRVMDDGPGFKPDEVGRAFDYKSGIDNFGKEGSTQVGLNSVRLDVESMGGKVEVAGGPQLDGGPTTLQISLPRGRGGEKLPETKTRVEEGAAAGSAAVAQAPDHVKLAESYGLTVRRNGPDFNIELQRDFEWHHILIPIGQVPESQIGQAVECLGRYQNRYPDMTINFGTYLRISLDGINKSYERWKYETGQPRPFTEFLAYLDASGLPHEIAPFVNAIDYRLQAEFGARRAEGSISTMYEGNNIVYSVPVELKDGARSSVFVKLGTRDGIDEQVGAAVLEHFDIPNYKILSVEPEWTLMERVPGIDIRALERIGYDPDSGLRFSDLQPGGQYYEPFIESMARIHAYSKFISIPDRHFKNIMIALVEGADGAKTLELTCIDLERFMQHDAENLHLVETEGYDGLFGPNYLRGSDGKILQAFEEAFKQEWERLSQMVRDDPQGMERLMNAFLQNPETGPRIESIPAFRRPAAGIARSVDKSAEISPDEAFKQFSGP